MDKNIDLLKQYLKNYIEFTEKNFKRNTYYNKTISYEMDKGNYKSLDNEIFKNSMFFIDESKFEYLIINNITLMIKKIQEKETEQESSIFIFKNLTCEKFFDNFFLKFFEETGDLSHLFFTIIYNIIEIINEKNEKDKKNYLKNLNFQIRKYFYEIKSKVLDLICKYETNLDNTVIKY